MNESLLNVPAQAAIELDTPAFKDFLMNELKEDEKWSDRTYFAQQLLVWKYIQKEYGFTPEEIVLLVSPLVALWIAISQRPS